MQTYWIAALVFGIIIALFAVQNSSPTGVHFLWLSAEGVPVSVLILICAALGALVTGMLGLGREVRHQFRQRAQRRAVTAHEKRLAEVTAERDQLSQDKATLQAQVDTLIASGAGIPRYEAVPIYPQPLGDAPKPSALPEGGQP
jgi:uncharacterized integral membrane protein